MPHELNVDDEFLSLLRFARSPFFSRFFLSVSPNGVPISTIMIGMCGQYTVGTPRERENERTRETKMHLTGAYNVTRTLWPFHHRFY